MSDTTDIEKGPPQEKGNFKILIPPTYCSQLMASTTDDPQQSKHDNFRNTVGHGHPEQRGVEGESVMHLHLWPTAHPDYQPQNLAISITPHPRYGQCIIQRLRLSTRPSSKVGPRTWMAYSSL